MPNRIPRQTTQSKSTSRSDASAIDALLELFKAAPLWLGPAVAALAFVAARWLVPGLFKALLGSSDLGSGVAGTLAILSSQAAPYISGLVLLLWVIAAIAKWNNHRRLEKQTGAASIDLLSWREFESLLSEAFRRQGFQVEHTGRTGPDGGIDLRLHKAGVVTLVQCKHWKQRAVGVAVVRELLGVVAGEGAHDGILVTSHSFTPDAVAFARNNPIRLIDGDELVAMISEVQQSQRIKMMRPTTADATHFPNGPVVPQKTEQGCPLCPVCGGTMILRVARKGANPGSRFYGCSNFPKCRGTRPVSTLAG